MTEGFVYTAPNRDLASPGEVLLAEMPLPRGLYVVFAKFNVEFNSPFPATPGARGIARLLVLGNDPTLDDSTWSGVDESSQTETIVLTACGAVRTLLGGAARLLFSPGAAVNVDKVKITAISLDGLSSDFLGRGYEGVTDALPIHPVKPVIPPSA
jgi:hypothetical protein